MTLNELYNRQKYMTYIAEHRGRVMCAFIRIFVYNENKKFNVLVKEGLMNSHIYHKLAEDIMVHDESKYSDEEFDGYIARFYNENEKAQTQEEIALNKEKFDEAWKHHYQNNSHHPMYWKTHHYNQETDTIETMEEGLYDMPLFAIYHMICDWQAMSDAKGNTVVQWYTTKADKEKASMTKNTREKVEYILSILYDVPIEELR